MLFLLIGLSTTSHAGTIKLHLENDLLAGTDRHYTHGTRIDYTFERLHVPSKLLWLQDNPLYPLRGRDFTLGFFVGQLMYTPEDISLEDPPSDDRPYAGWLYVGYQAQRNFTESDSDIGAFSYGRADRFALSLGVIGKASGAEHVQKRVHKWTDSQRPEGWDNQIAQKAAIDVMYQHDWRVGHHFDNGWGAEVLPFAGGNLGNVFILGRLGAMFRAGYNIPDDFGVSPIRPTVFARAEEAPVQKFGAYVFVTTEGRLVLHNQLLTGSTPVEGQDIEREDWVSDLIWGVSTRLYERLAVDYMMIKRSKEFTTQRQSQHFAAVSVSYSF